MWFGGWTCAPPQHPSTGSVHPSGRIYYSEMTSAVSVPSRTDANSPPGATPPGVERSYFCEGEQVLLVSRYQRGADHVSWSSCRSLAGVSGCEGGREPVESSRSRWRHRTRPVKSLLKTKGVQKRSCIWCASSVCQRPPLLHGFFGVVTARWNTFQAGGETDGWREVESCWGWSLVTSESD